QALELSRIEKHELQLAMFLRILLNAGYYDYSSAPRALASVDAALSAVRKFEAGMRIMCEVPFLKDTLDSIRHLSERFDGTGYPNRLSGDAIPLISRIGAVVIAYDEMVTPRTNGDSTAPAIAIETLRSASETKYDPNVIDAFCSLHETVGIH